MSASTQYWVTSAFYLHWISLEQVIYEAVGLEDLTCEWQVSKDGGKTFVRRHAPRQRARGVEH